MSKNAEKITNKRYRISRRFLIFWTLFIGIGAVGGSLCMLIDPSGKSVGMDGLLPFFQVLPFADKLFQNLTFSGIMLLIVNGITNLTASALLFAKRKSGIILGTIFGFTLMLWIIIQFIIFPTNVMSTLFFIFGFLQLVTGFYCYVGYNQSKFDFDEKQYQDIGKDKTKLVVFFSRTGYTKKLAYEIANEQKADILEIKTTEKIAGNLGFWWCGRFGMMRLGMPLQKIDTDLQAYEEITICSPVWVFGLSAPIKQFCLQNKGKIKSVNYCLVHFMNAKFNKLATTLDDLLDTKHKTFRSFRCHYGKIKELK